MRRWRAPQFIIPRSASVRECAMLWELCDYSGHSRHAATQLYSSSEAVARRGMLRLRLVTSQGSPYPSRSPRAHPSGWTRTQGLSHRDSHAPPSFGTTPVRMWNWPLAPLLRRAGNQVVREMPSHTRPSNPGAGSESSNPPRRPLTITRRNGTNGFNGCPSESVSLRKLGRPGKGCEGRYATDPDAS